VGEVERLLTDPVEYDLMASAPNPYGDGHAASRVVHALSHLVFRTPPPESFRSILNRRVVLDEAGYPAGLVASTLQAGAKRVGEESEDREGDDWMRHGAIPSS
jgi:UDP-N-acetylglucosamine 2-epimerase (non-hydrolysing)